MGQIRIIGGKWRGRKLSISNKYNLRPTTSKIRETLFNWLIPVIQKTHCLDCFAGSGALAIEALSHNAASATLIELKYHIATQLMLNLSKLKTKNAQVINSNVLNYLAKKGTAYDIVFLDPPFHKNLLQQTTLLLEQNGWLTKDCWIYVEAEAKTNLTVLPKNWQLQHKKTTGQVTYCLYFRHQ